MLSGDIHTEGLIGDILDVRKLVFCKTLFSCSVGSALQDRLCRGGRPLMVSIMPWQSLQQCPVILVKALSESARAQNPVISKDHGANPHCDASPRGPPASTHDAHVLAALSLAQSSPQ